jgi:hypothetical protein
VPAGLVVDREDSEGEKELLVHRGYPPPVPEVGTDEPVALYRDQQFEPEPYRHEEEVLE